MSFCQAAAIFFGGLIFGRIMRAAAGRRENVSLKYLEAANAVGWLGIGIFEGLNCSAAVGMFLFSLCLLISMTDLERCIIPNGYILIFLLAGLANHYFVHDLSLPERLLGLAAGFAVPFFLSLFCRGGIGGGDVKLTAVMGFWLGVTGVFYALFIGALSGSIAGLVLMAAGIKKRGEAIPFGPFLLLGFLLIRQL